LVVNNSPEQASVSSRNTSTNNECQLVCASLSIGHLRELPFDSGLLDCPLLRIRPTLNNSILPSTIARYGEHVVAYVLDGVIAIA